jgi:hypothetical protein
MRPMFKAPTPQRSTTSHHDPIGPVPVGIAIEHDAPGAPLHEVLALVQARVPAVTGLIVRDGQLYIVHEGEHDERACARARAVIADGAALAKLAARAAEPPAEPEPEELAPALLDDALPDDAWLRTFRRYQAALLRAAAPEPEPTPALRKKRSTKARGGEAE